MLSPNCGILQKCYFYKSDTGTGPAGKSVVWGCSLTLLAHIIFLIQGWTNHKFYYVLCYDMYFHWKKWWVCKNYFYFLLWTQTWYLQHLFDSLCGLAVLIRKSSCSTLSLVVSGFLGHLCILFDGAFFVHPLYFLKLDKHQCVYVCGVWYVHVVCSMILLLSPYKTGKTASSYHYLAKEGTETHYFSNNFISYHSYWHLFS